ncbi:MAG: hypothetical protein C4297_13315 [Gemmataceae bacterium]
MIPLWLKIAYTGFLAMLVPVYWYHYGPVNFLFLCDVALFVTFLALWAESSLLASSQLLVILLPQTIWMLDFFTYLLVRVPLTGVTAYMFEADRPLYLRALSLFHIWLPILLVWMTCRLGYDRRAPLLQLAILAIVLPLSYMLSLPPDQERGQDNPWQARNVNYVYGFPEEKRQTIMPAWLWLVCLIGFHVGCVNLPTHAVCTWLCQPPGSKLTSPSVNRTLDSSVESAKRKGNL